MGAQKVTGFFTKPSCWGCQICCLQFIIARVSNHATTTQLWIRLTCLLGRLVRGGQSGGCMAHFQSVCRSLYSQLFVSAISTLSLRPHSQSRHR